MPAGGGEPAPAMAGRAKAAREGCMKGSVLKRIVAWAAALALICGGVLGGAAFFLNGSYLAGRFTTAVSDAGHTLVFRETPVFSLFPPRFDFGQIAGTARLGSIFIEFTVESGSAEPDLAGFLAGRFELDKLTLNRPVLKLKPSPATVTDAPAQKGSADFPEIGQIFVQDAQVDFVSPAGHLLLADLKLAGQNIRSRKDMDLQSDFVLDWDPASGCPVSGNLAIQTKLRYYAPALTFRKAALTFTATDNGFLSRYSPLQIHFEGGLDLQTLRPRVRNLELSVPDLRFVGKGEFQNGKFAGKASLETDLSLFSPVQGQVGIESPFELTGRSVSLLDISLKLGSSSGSGTAKLEFGGGDEPFAIAADLSAGALDLDEFAFAGEIDRSYSAVPFSWPRLDIRLALKGMRKARLELEDIAATLRGGAGSYRIENFAATWAQGKITASSLLDFAGSRFSLTSQGKRLNLGEILGQLGIGWFAGGKTDYALELTSAGRAIGEAPRHMAGSGRISCENLAIRLPAGVAFFMGKPGRNLPDALEHVRINFHGKDGRIAFSPVTANGPGFEASGSAALELASEQLSGSFSLKALGFEFPVSFKGPWGDLSWSFARSSQ